MMFARNFTAQRWLAILGMAVLLGACGQLPPCPGPGIASKTSCHYVLDIVDSKGTGPITGTVAKDLVTKEAGRVLAGFHTDEYEYFPYKFQVEDMDRNDLVAGKTFEFCSVPNKDVLKPAPPKVLKDSKEEGPCPNASNK